MYSFGVLSSVVWNNGGMPYSEHNFPNPLDLQNAVIAEGLRPTVRADCPEELRAVMASCWSATVDDRPSFATIADYLGQLLDYMLQKR